VDRLSVPRFALMGHSMGGAHAFVYAAQNPQRVAALVIEDMGPGASSSSAGAQRIRRELRETPDRFDTWDDAAAFWRKQRPNVSAVALQARVQHSMKRSDDGPIVWRHDAQGIAQARLNATPEQLVDLWPYVLGVRAPTLLLRGERSDFLSAHTAVEMTARNPFIQGHDIPEATHYVHDDNLPVFERRLHEFLAHPSLAPWAAGDR
jgi:pimeloyl-ACP methyl ester carboxylesterase